MGTGGVVFFDRNATKNIFTLLTFLQNLSTNNWVKVR